MYFLKRTPSEVVVQPPLNFEHYHEQFQFARYIYASHHRASADLRVASPALVADMAAAAVTILFKAKLLEKVTTSFALRCCRDVIDHSGYAEQTAEAIKRTIFATGCPSTIVIPGCQEERMLIRRVEAAVQFVGDFDANYQVVFSGKNPSQGSKYPVRIRDEAHRMGAIFTDKLRELNTRQKMPKLQYASFEAESSTTDTNIANLFEGPYIDQSQKTNLVVVSSSFHLIRLASAISKQIVNWKGTGEIANVVLVGAESIEKLFYPEDDEYVKLMMFEVFHNLLKTELYWPALPS